LPAAHPTTFHLPYARRLFDAEPHPNVFLYTAMLSAYVFASSFPAHARAPDALALFLRRGCPAPNQFVHPLALRSACKSVSYGYDVV
jgi:hypothetical protein